MKRSRLLLLIPLLLLTGCEKEKEITVDEAKNIIQQIKTTEIKDSYMFALTNKGGIGKDESQITVDLSYQFKRASTGYYSYIKGVNGDVSYDAEMYCVKNFEYGEVKYVKYFDAKTNAYVKAVATYKDDEEYENAFADLGVYRTESVLSYYLGAEMFTEKADEGDVITLLSSGEGQLTIQCVTNVKNPSDYTEEIVSKGKSVYKYEDYRFAGVNVETSSNYGNKWLTKGAMEYNDKITVELPSDWESYLTLAK